MLRNRVPAPHVSWRNIDRDRAMIGRGPTQYQKTGYRPFQSSWQPDGNSAADVAAGDRCVLTLQYANVDWAAWLGLCTKEDERTTQAQWFRH